MTEPAQRHNLVVDAAVADLLGVEQVEHLRGTPGAVTGQCWRCEQPVDGAREPVSILALRPAGTPTLTVVKLAHPTCIPSGVHQLRDTDVLLDTQGDGTAVSAVTTVWPVPTSGGLAGPADPAATRPRPVVLMSFAGDIAMLTESGDRIDLVAQALLRQGWHLVTDMDAVPPPLPTGWRLRCQLDPGRTDAPGTLAILDPSGDALALDIPLWPSPLWLHAALVGARRSSIYVGPLHLEHTWANGPDIAVVERAIHTGALVGGVVDVEVHS